MDAEWLLQELEMPALRETENEAFLKRLSQHLNHLLLHDFPRLVQLLYRLDVSEEKVKTVLKENADQDAGDLLAALIAQRQLDKKATTHTHRFSADDSDEERW